MPRWRHRICLKSGLKLDLNKLMRQGVVRRGERSGPYLIRWTNSYTGELTANALLTADMRRYTKGRFISKWPTWSSRSFSRRGGDISVAISGISCVRARAVAARAVATPRCRRVSLSKGMEWACRLYLTIPGSRSTRASRPSENQGLLNWRQQSRRMGTSAKAKVDAVENVQ